MKILSTIRPAPAADGPYLVITELNGAITNATLGVASINAALDQAKSDQAAVLQGTLQDIVITTRSDG